MTDFRPWGDAMTLQDVLNKTGSECVADILALSPFWVTLTPAEQIILILETEQTLKGEPHETQ